MSLFGLSFGWLSAGRSKETDEALFRTVGNITYLTFILMIVTMLIYFEDTFAQVGPLRTGDAILG